MIAVLFLCSCCVYCYRVVKNKPRLMAKIRANDFVVDAGFKERLTEEEWIVIS